MPHDPENTTEANRRAWNSGRFEAWQATYGAPEAEATKILADPARPLRRLTPYMGTVAGKRVAHVQGSHGRVAVALALSGAAVTVLDFSEENRRYALALAAAAGVDIEYRLGDIMQAGMLGHPFDLLVLELGVLHYHRDLAAFFAVMRQLAGQGALLLLNEFHPVHRKLFWAEGPRDYFYAGLTEADVPNPQPGGPSLGRCQYRFWTQGDIMTCVVAAGFVIESLSEHPDWDDPVLPGSFTLVARAA